MYSVYIDKTKIFDDAKPNNNYNITEPTLTLEKGAAGSLEFTVSPNGLGYDLIAPMTSTVRVYKNDKPGYASDGETWLYGTPIWQGRILDVTTDFFKRKKVHVEGALAVLNDTTTKKFIFKAGTTVKSVFDTIIGWHNEKIQKLTALTDEMVMGRSFILSGVAPDDTLGGDFECSYESSMEAINKLIDDYGGFLYIRHRNGANYIFWYTDDTTAFNTTQEINFGVNMFDYTNEVSYADFATVCVPHGSSHTVVIDGEEVEDYYNCSGYNIAQGRVAWGDAVISPSADEFGWIEKVVDFDGINPETYPGYAQVLYQLGEMWLSTLQYEEMTITVSALDMKVLSPNDSSVEPIDLCDSVRCYSRPHNIDIVLPVSKLEIKLDDVTSAKYTLSKKSAERSLSSESAHVQSSVEEVVGRDSPIVRKAQKDAAAKILSATSGYITIKQNPTPSGHRADALYISNNKDVEAADKKWVWNIEGLGFINGTGTDAAASVAITMDGHIVADAVTAGTLTGVTIRGNHIIAGGSAYTNPWGNHSVDGGGVIDVNNSNDKTVVRINTDGITTDAADGYTLKLANGELCAYDSTNNLVGRINLINQIDGGGRSKSLMTLSSNVLAMDTDELCVKHDNTWFATMTTAKLPFVKSATLTNNGNKVTLTVVKDGLLIEKGIILGTTGESTDTSSVTIDAQVDDGGSEQGTPGQGSSGQSTEVKPVARQTQYHSNTSVLVYWYQVPTTSDAHAGEYYTIDSNGAAHYQSSLPKDAVRI